ncbi:MAG: aspartyl-phosphate phosphatase Spo0E family protein [Clostridia bacterium]|nr:aspartyl-phosphate phosphatase Spo0E family protein [Clostridia bacterium]
MSTPEIEKERRILITLGEKYGLNLQHPEVQSYSQKLDMLIAEVQRERLKKRREMTKIVVVNNEQDVQLVRKVLVYR